MQSSSWRMIPMPMTTPCLTWGRASYVKTRTTWNFRNPYQHFKGAKEKKYLFYIFLHHRRTLWFFHPRTSCRWASCHLPRLERWRNPATSAGRDSFGNAPKRSGLPKKDTEKTQGEIMVPSGYLTVCHGKSPLLIGKHGKQLVYHL